jgi:spore maturation protein CgeB
MYQILGETKIIINRHISAAENYANNMRLFESTGMGALLITDEKQNLNDLFTVGTEVMAYRDVDDLAEKIRYYLSHETERERIAAAGQRRTLTDHTYQKRMGELLQIIERYL